ncbi:TPA: DoxX family membrane protein [Candidatus Woesearchaeota archaeon]|nr:DoxX family membrane protein [Candidatus Woesearchaeota archaeon]HIH46666.1 DoxX family membrane protein [Candidatus Woesearchaeota archaeon]HII89370.1 DoxX family membrane protein [Candidatus Woesearchaeota archaeon]
MEQTCRHGWTSVVMRITLGFLFFYAAIGKLFMGKAPPIEKIITFMPKETSVMLLAIVELIIGLLLIFGLITKITAWASAVLFAIFMLSGLALGIFTQSGLVKDIPLLAMSLYFAFKGCTGFGLDCLIRKL